MTKIATIDEGISYLADDGSPMPMDWREALVIEALEALEIVLDQAEKR